MHGEEPEEWSERMRVGKQPVREAVKDHIEERKAEGRGRIPEPRVDLDPRRCPSEDVVLKDQVCAVLG